MPNWSSIKAGFLKQSYPRQLGELASCLARIKAWCSDIESAKLCVPVVLSESLFYLSLLIEADGRTPEFTQLEQLLLSWQQNWAVIITQPTKVAIVRTTSATWSDCILDMSGLLTTESEYV